MLPNFSRGYMRFGFPRSLALRFLTTDGWLLFATRCTRLFAYGLLSVILVLYLSEVGLSDAKIGLLLTLTLLGDTAISLWITTKADRIGRRRMLILGALLMVFAGLLVRIQPQLRGAVSGSNDWGDQSEWK